MTREQFEKLVNEGFEAIPEKFRIKIKNVAILIDDAPSAEIRKRQKLASNETLLGLYQGIPHTYRGDNYGIGATMPDIITIFQKAIEQQTANDPEKIRKLVAEVIWHEYAHYFGMNEDEVRKKEGKRKN